MFNSYHFRNCTTALAFLILTSACAARDAPVTPCSEAPSVTRLQTAETAFDIHQVEQDMHGLARTLARTLADSVARVQLTNAIRKSALREHIVELRSLRPLLSNQFKSSGPAEWVWANLDLYVPVAEHRQRFYHGDDFLILPYPNWLDSEQIIKDGLTAYDLSGKTVTLSARTPPELPVLVLTVCEHKGVGHQNASVSKAHVNDCLTGNGQLIIDETHVYNANELWPDGAPEIEVRMRPLDNGAPERTVLDFISRNVDIGNCDDRDVYHDRAPLSPRIDETQAYEFQVYETDRFPNPDDLIFSWDIDIDGEFAGPGVANRKLFTDGSNCNSKDIEFWLYWE